MNKMTFVLTLSLILLIAFGSDAQAQIAKEGNLSFTIGYTITFKDVGMGQEIRVRTYELLGATISDSGEGPLHNSSVRCVGALRVVKGNIDDESGLCVCTKPDGDQIFMTYKAATGKVGVTAKGTGTFVGGTGKMTGFDGSCEWSRVMLRPAAEGTGQGYNRVKGNYKLP